LQKVNLIIEEKILSSKEVGTADVDSQNNREYEFIRRLQRDRQPAFRKNLLHAYASRCCITECSTVASLEAAHIDRFSAGGSDSVSNGLVLRADLHRLFDAKLLTMRWKGETLVCVVNQKIHDDQHRKIHNKIVRLPEDRTSWPLRRYFP
jgi:putative restriction endonuclease